MARDVSLYVVDGEPVPSVTEIFGITGLTDLSMIPSSILYAAALRGDGVHEWIGLATNSPDAIRGINPPPVLAPYIAAWEKWLAESGFEIELAEEVVVSDLYRFAGKFDLVGKINGARAVVDYKCIVSLGPVIGLQLSGYEIALDLGEPLKRLALQLLRNGTYRFQAYDKPSDRYDFIAATRVAHWKLDHGLSSLDEIRRAA